MRDKVLIVYEGHFMRNYVHIQDICRAFTFAIDNWDFVKNDTYNVGNDNINMSKLQLCNKIMEHLPLEIIEAEITKDPDKRNYIVSSQKFYDKGFECICDLSDGIEQLIKMYKMIDEPFYANY
jgi:nucleoside-diphosphate-sugar epimerase